MRASLAVSTYLLLVGTSLARLGSSPGFAAGEALAGMVVFGLLFSLVALGVTRGATPRPVEVRRPGRELAAVTAYLVVFAAGFLGWGLSALRAAVPGEPQRSVVLLVAKLAAMVLAPALVLVAMGHGWRELLRVHRPDRVERRALLVMGALLLLLQLVAGRGPKLIEALPQPAWAIALAAPFALAWMCLEAGLTEEFLFRVAFQTRAAAWLRSETAGLVAMAVLFGLAHAPGYVLRGAHAMEGFASAPDPLTAAAYSIVVVSPIGLAFGVLWARTRSLLLVVLLHGWTDLVPNLAEFVRTWSG
ncbi:MAG TPA: CPBP family intramembrane glutamic endopeptidase [Vicinamibacteria bacterium]